MHYIHICFAIELSLSLVHWYEWYSWIDDCLILLNWDMSEMLLLWMIFTLMIVMNGVILSIFCTSNIFWAHPHPCLLCLWHFVLSWIIIYRSNFYLSWMTTSRPLHLFIVFPNHLIFVEALICNTEISYFVTCYYIYLRCLSYFIYMLCWDKINIFFNVFYVPRLINICYN